MMEMEMNAELGEEGGSETSQSSSEGSSASSTFCTLEQDYLRITREMKENELLSPYEVQYTRLYESLYQNHKNEKALLENCKLLEEQIIDYKKEVNDLKKEIENDGNEIMKLKEEVIDSKKMAYAAHNREQNAQEVIENLQISINKLEQEIQYKNRQLTDQEDTSMSKQKESLLKEIERLTNENETLKDRHKYVSSHVDDLEEKCQALQKDNQEKQGQLENHEIVFLKEKLSREKVEEEVQSLNEKLKNKEQELRDISETLKGAMSNILKLENLGKEDKLTNEKLKKENHKLMLKSMSLRTDLDGAKSQIENLEKGLFENGKNLKNKLVESGKLKEEVLRMRIERDSLDKKLLKADHKRGKQEQDLKNALTSVNNLEIDLLACRKLIVTERQQTETHLREKNILARARENLQDRIKSYKFEFEILDQSEKKMKNDLENAERVTMEQKRQLQLVEKERDKFGLEIQNLEQQMEDALDKVKLKQMEIVDYKKLLEEGQLKYQQQMNLFDAIQAERNACTRSLAAAQNEIQDLKKKLTTTHQQIKHLEEDISTKEAIIVKGEFLLGKMEKEKDDLQSELQSSHKENTKLRKQIEEMKQETKRLREMIRQTDVKMTRLKKTIDDVTNERDIIRAQLTKRKEEINEQNNRIQALDVTLKHGETQYNQRLEDIRLLKLEVKRLRTEKVLLTKNIDNVTDLRQEVFHLNRDLTNEKLKVTALEEEVQTPLNIHRWRKLEGTDPDTFEMNKKIQILQKRIINMGTMIINKEKTIKEMEKLYTNLQDLISKHPGPEIAIHFNATQKSLREREKEMKCLVAELNVYELQSNEHKYDMERMNNAMNEFKNRYYTEKRKSQKSGQFKSIESILPPVTCQKKVFGGGFNMTASTKTASLEK